jgi:hypothetical protein
MKTLITIVFLFIFGTCFSQSFAPKIIIGNPIKIEKINKFGYNLEITQYDFPINMNWEDANKACRALGDGWRLPNVPELLAMGSKGYTPNTFYWSSEEDGDTTNPYFARYLIKGRTIDNYDKDSKQTVRAIRNIDTNSPIASDKILDKNFENSKIGNLEIALNDFQNVMNWEDAKNACNNLGNGWRLPNKDELNVLYKNKYIIGGFNDFLIYWSASEDGFFSVGQSFNTGNFFQNQRTDKYHVRAVRTF